MTEKRELYDIEDAISDDINEGGSSSSRPEVIEIKDASLKIAETLVPQVGSDDSFLREGRVDTRRFTNVSEKQVWWLSWFDIIPPEYGGGFSRMFCDSFRNHRYSVNAENKRIAVGMTQAITGASRQKKDDTKRSLLDKILRRKKEPELYEVDG